GATSASGKTNTEYILGLNPTAGLFNSVAGASWYSHAKGFYVPSISELDAYVSASGINNLTASSSTFSSASGTTYNFYCYNNGTRSTSSGATYTVCKDFVVSGVSGSAAMIVSKSPTIATPSLDPICEGGSITLEPEVSGLSCGTASYLWSSNAGSVRTASVTLNNITSATTYRVTVTNVPYQKYDYIEIGNMKGIVTTTPNATTGTQGQAVALTDAIASAYCSTGPTISVSDQLVKDALVVNGGAETTSRKGFYIPLDATGGVCASTMEFPVEVTPLPTPTISQANNYTELTCSRTSITLTANGNGGTFAWSGGGTGSSKTVSTAGTYTVTETKNGCQGTSEGYVISSNTTKPDKPTGASSNAYCGTSNAVFSVSAPSSPLTIDWYSSESGGSPVWTGESSHTVNGLSSTATYYAVTRNTNTGCVSTSRTGVTSTINSIPTPTISQSNNYHELTCSRTIITLTANGSGGTFAWSGGGTSSTKDVTTAGPYTVTETKNGCSGTSDEYTITSNTTAPTVSVTGTNEICLGESTTLHTTSNANYTYLWSNSVETYNNTVSPNTTTTYSVTTTDSRNNCSATASRTVTVKTPNIDASSYDYIWRGVSTDWNTVSNWYVYNSGYSVATELPTTAKNIYIGTGLCLTSSNWPSQTGEANANNITIASGASLTIPASKTLNIAGSITNNGT
ncbi:MAG: hypothetical protein II060_10890, partial [Bacteroidales bacterium]|nr:hypothetical protein [Bacteroidales bacterium]